MWGLGIAYGVPPCFKDLHADQAQPAYTTLNPKPSNCPMHHGEDLGLAQRPS